MSFGKEGLIQIQTWQEDADVLKLGHYNNYNNFIKDCEVSIHFASYHSV